MFNIFIYTENVIESHSGTHNNNLLYKTQPKHQITFSKLQLFKNPHFQKLDIHSIQRFPPMFMARLGQA